MSKDTRNYYDERKDQNTMNYYARKSSGGQGIICDEDTGRTVAVVYDDKDLALLAAAPALLAARWSTQCARWKATNSARERISFVIGSQPRGAQSRKRFF